MIEILYITGKKTIAIFDSATAAWSKNIVSLNKRAKWCFSETNTIASDKLNNEHCSSYSKECLLPLIHWSKLSYIFETNYIVI